MLVILSGVASSGDLHEVMLFELTNSTIFLKGDDMKMEKMCPECGEFMEPFDEEDGDVWFCKTCSEKYDQILAFSF